MKDDCVSCHQLGNKATREIPEALGTFASSVAAWDRRIQSGQAGGNMSNGLNVFGRPRALKMYADWTDRVANGAITKMAYATISNNSAVGIGGGGIASATVVIDAIKERQATIAAVLGHPFAFPTAPPTALLQSTIVANSVGSNCLGTFSPPPPTIISLGFNLSSDGSFCGGGTVGNANPNLGPLANNGGPALGDVRSPDSGPRGAQAGDDVVEPAGATLTQALLVAGFRFDPANRAHRDSRNESRYTIYRLPYEPITAGEGALRPEIQIETAVWPLRRPAVALPVSSFVAEASNRPPEVPSIACVPITQTVAEKFVALTRRTAAEIADAGGPRDATLVRHLYDLHVMRAHYDPAEVATLARTIMPHDAAVFGNQFPAYRAHPMAETLRAIEALEADPGYAGRYAGGRAGRSARHGPHPQGDVHHRSRGERRAQSGAGGLPAYPVCGDRSARQRQPCGMGAAP